jgi:hypothetical protein
MQKQLTQLEVKVAEKIYQFTCDPSSPIEHAKEALFQFMKYIGAIEDAIKAQQAQAVLPKTDLPVTDEFKQEAA